VDAVDAGNAGGRGGIAHRAVQCCSGNGPRIVSRADPEWGRGLYVGAHAGKYDLSQMLAMRQDRVDLSLLQQQKQIRHRRAVRPGRLAAEPRPITAMP